MRALIEIHNLTLRRANQTVLSIPTLSIYEGEVLAVVGPNGAGKSTFLLTLAGLLTPLSGKITFADRPLQQWKPLDYRRQIALVLQEPLLFDRSVLDNLLLGLQFRKIPRAQAVQRAFDWLERFGVAHLAQRQAQSLSGGEAQRVSLARAFVLEPRLLLLDEPFASLDPPTRAELYKHLRTILRENQVTTVFVTHHLHEAGFLGDRIAVFGETTLKQVGTLKQILENPLDATVADFVRHFSEREIVSIKN
ncbi:MAG: ABC transporter [Anaerolineae bacterium]|nr:MAG: ABC transporter [Anaerolineae bacterium]